MQVEMSDTDSKAEKDLYSASKAPNASSTDVEAVSGDSYSIRIQEFNVFQRFSEKLDNLGVEERGLQRVLTDQRTETSKRSIFWLTFLW